MVPAMRGHVGRWLRTVVYIPPQALLWRVWARAKRIFYRSPLYGLHALWQTNDALPEMTWVGVELIAGDDARGARLAKGTWTLAGKPETLGVPPRHWGSGGLQDLQVFGMHYHEWLADLKAANQRDAAQALVADWLVHFAHYHPVAWHPYPLSLRIVAWLTYGPWLLKGADAELKLAFTRVLVDQIWHLRHNCEWDLGGNHLLKNLKALLLGGMALGDEGRDLALWAEATLLRALRHQVLSDGGHDERTPLYHAQVLRDVLETRAALRKHGGGRGVWDDFARRMGTALAFYTYPDGGVGLFNDSEEMEPRVVAALLRLSGADDAPACLPDSGYARLARGHLQAVLDGGPVGPDANPGHAHADMLSFELSVGEQRVIVNGGTYAYQHALRTHFRGTAAHSTLELTGENSAEVWAAFRVGRRPRRVGLRWVAGADGEGDAVVDAWHDGYRHRGLAHRRTLRMTDDGRAMVGEDVVVLRRGRARVAVRFHVHPLVAVRLVGERVAHLLLPNGRKMVLTSAVGRLDVRESRYAPHFNTVQPTKQIVLLMTCALPETRLGWELRLDDRHGDRGHKILR